MPCQHYWMIAAEPILGTPKVRGQCRECQEVKEFAYYFEEAIRPDVRSSKFKASGGYGISLTPEASIPVRFWNQAVDRLR